MDKKVLQNLKTSFSGHLPTAAITIIGNGFLGRSLIDRILEIRGEVNVVYRSSSPEPKHPHISFFRYLPNDNKTLQDSIANGGVCVFVAGTTFPSSQPERMALGADEELKLLKKVGHVLALKNAKLVYVSSSSVYGEIVTGSAHESTPTAPINDYGNHKLKCEQLCKSIADNTGMELTILRLSNPFGIHQLTSHSAGLIGAILRNVKNNKVTTLHYNGQQIRDYFNVNLLSDIVLKISSCYGKSPRLLNISSGIGLSANQVCHIISTYLKTDIAIAKQIEPHDQINRSVLDPSKAQRWMGIKCYDHNIESWLNRVGFKKT